MGRRKVSSTRGGIKNGGKNYFSSTKFHRAIQKYGWGKFYSRNSL